MRSGSEIGAPIRAVNASGRSSTVRGSFGKSMSLSSANDGSVLVVASGVVVVDEEVVGDDVVVVVDVPVS